MSNFPIKVTLGITGLCTIRALINFDGWHLDVGSVHLSVGNITYSQGSSPYIWSRELGSERCKSVWSISL